MRQQEQQSAGPMLQQGRDDLDREHSNNRLATAVAYVVAVTNWLVGGLLQRPLLFIWDTLCRLVEKVNRIKNVWKWRFVGFTSTLVGFTTFAITPPFTKLLDHGFWGGFGIAIYCAIGISVCCVMLFTPRWRVSKNKVLTAHVAFFVLMITSLYSFFVDKMEEDKEKKGWQKMLNLISCGAFSVMSLSLSRLTGLGFEVGVFNFFLGSFMSAVLAWNGMFLFIAATFCYILIIIRVWSDSKMQISIPSSDSNDIEQGQSERSR